MPDTPLTNAITALTTYANTVTGESDTDLSSAVATLCDGYGGGGTSLSLTSQLDPTVSLVKGYFASNGTTITSQSNTSKEVTTDYIDISALNGEDIYFISETPANIVPWVAYTKYDSSKVLQGTRNIALELITSATYLNDNTGFTHYGVNAGSMATGKILNLTSDIKYIRISFRTGGNGKLSLIKKSDMDPADYWDRTIKEITISNKLTSDGNAT